MNKTKAYFVDNSLQSDDKSDTLLSPDRKTNEVEDKSPPSAKIIEIKKIFEDDLEGSKKNSVLVVKADLTPSQKELVDKYTKQRSLSLSFGYQYSRK